MAASKLGRVNFIMLGVKDIEKSLAFYRDKLGLSVKSQTPGLAFLDGGSVTLALSVALGGTRPARIAGATEIVFGVPDVQSAYDELCENGVKFMTQPHQVSGK